MTDYETYTDEQLIQRLRQGETEISDYLMEKYKHLVRKKARAMYLIGGETDDLIQEGMIGLFKAVRDFSPEREASFQTFAHLCIDRQLYNAVNGSNRQKHQPLNSYVSLSEQEADQAEISGPWMQNPEAIIIDRENAMKLEEEIRKCLSSFENRVLDYYLQGIGYIEIAELMNKTPKSIDNAMQRIRTKIRNFSDQKRK